VSGYIPSKHKPILERDLTIGHHQELYRFDNGFGASVVSGGYGAFAQPYGGLEMAVVSFPSDDPLEFVLRYDTPLTDDVLGHLVPEEIDDLLDQVAALPKDDV